jgi:hypothetical protein
MNRLATPTEHFAISASYVQFGRLRRLKMASQKSSLGQTSLWETIDSSLIGVSEIAEGYRRQPEHNRTNTWEGVCT